ncbi:MAG: class I SAM-dependent methyltransferase [Pirellula sp.]|nr:class I SAM-dependent methyltransferase [Pirellula sp.]
MNPKHSSNSCNTEPSRRSPPTGSEALSTGSKALPWNPRNCRLRLPFHQAFAFRVFGLSLLLAGWALGSTATAQEKQDADKPSKAGEPRGLTKYMGRRIASPMGYQHMDWLSRPERIQEENPQEMLDQLKLKDGMVVCDLGSGDGYHTLQMAPKVGPSGKVVAVDIQPQMLQELSRRMAANKIGNIDTILGDLWDPKLQPESIDLVLMVDVYHEFSHPVQMLSAIRKALKPTGRIALVEFRAEDPTVLIRPEHKMSKVQILKEYKDNGFRVASEYDKLPWQHLMFMEKDDTK